MSSHVFFSKALRNRLVIPNKVVVSSRTNDDPQYSGSATDAASYDLLPKTEYQQMRLTSNVEAQNIAEAILSKYQLNAEMGAANVPMNCGAELFDYVKVTDAREGDYRIGNIGSLTRNYSPGKYTLSFSFGNWLTVRKLLKDLEINSDVGNYFAKLIVDNLYAKHIQADSLDMVWLDPQGNVDLSLIGDNLDSLPDGTVYSRIKAMHLAAGILQMDENVNYKPGYDPNTKRRTFTATPTTPYDVGDIWLDATTVKRCTTARATGAYVAGDWTATTIDAIADGTTFQRVKSSALTADGLVVLDQAVEGTYGLLRATDISAGHIKLTSDTVASGLWYQGNGVTIDADYGIDIYGGKLTLRKADGTGAGQLYIDAAGQLRLDPWSRIVTESIIPFAHNFYQLGTSSTMWKYLYVKEILSTNYSIMNTYADFDAVGYMDMPRRSSAPTAYGGRSYYPTGTGRWACYDAVNSTWRYL